MISPLVARLPYSLGWEVLGLLSMRAHDGTILILGLSTRAANRLMASEFENGRSAA